MSGAAFRGELEFLSNFSRYPTIYRGERFPTAENAYQAAKTTDYSLWADFKTDTPGQAKRRGRRLEIRPDWEEVKLPIMRMVLAAKFTINPGLAELLVFKTPSYLVETNTWHDQIWGDCICPEHFGIPGQNLLGGSLMWLRAYLAGSN